ncbi:hypothetical protein [Phytohabitans houttuyneae]|nr:hypothetical protein [Phytohabitans houttuyneae]
MPRPFWLGLAQVAQTLCLDEIEDADFDEARAARVVRDLSGGGSSH